MGRYKEIEIEKNRMRDVLKGIQDEVAGLDVEELSQEELEGILNAIRCDLNLLK